MYPKKLNNTIIGQFRPTVGIIRCAKGLGYRTIVMNYLPDNIGLYEVDNFYVETNTCVESVYRIAKMEQFNEVLSCASDLVSLSFVIRTSAGFRQVS